MARFKNVGVSEYQLDFEAIANLPEELINEMLIETGKIAVEAQKASIKKLDLVDSKQLENSIKATAPKRRTRTDDAYIAVYPHGRRKDIYANGKLRLAGVKKMRVNKKKRRLEALKMENNDVGFVLEFGAPHQGIRAYQWMRRANEACAEDVARAQFNIFDNFFKSKNL